VTADEVADALLAATRFSLGEAAERAPRDAGIYSWWSKLPQIGGVPGTHHGDDYLYYVGIADRAHASLSARLHDHIRKTTRKSTDRKTLAALIGPERHWKTERVRIGPASHKTVTVLASADSEAELSAWMGENFRVSWVTLDRPGDVETAIFRILRPPLNLKGNTLHPEYPRVKAARHAFNASAPPLS